MRLTLQTAAAGFLLLVLGCGSGGGAGTGTLALSITDAPFPATDTCLSAAIIEIDGVSAKGASGFVDIALVDDTGAAADSVKIDLLNLRAGLADALALGEVSTGSYSEIRLHIVEATMQFTDLSPDQPFKVPSGMSSGLKLKIDPPVLVAAGQQVDLMLDVNLAESFHTTGLGGSPTCDDLKAGETMVIFHPVIRIVNLDTSGLVTGVVQDIGGSPAGDVEVTAFAAGEVVAADSIPVVTTFSTPAGSAAIAEGTYAVSLEPGTYDLYVRAQGVTDRTMAAGGVAVAAGEHLKDQTLTLP